MTQPARAHLPDYLRLVALFGIAVVNVQFIAFSSLSDPAEPDALTTLDRITLWLVTGLALLKAYGLFAFAFGVGLGLMMQAAERRGLPFGPLYRNRMIGLLLFGLAHGLLFFPGDILAIYAGAGSLLYLVRQWSERRLVKLGAALLLLQTLIAPLLLLAAAEPPADSLALEREALTKGSFLAAIAWRGAAFADLLPPLLVIQGIAALGWFCLGLAAVKSGLIDNPRHPLWQRARRFCLLPGLALSLAGAAVWLWGPPLPGALLTIAIAPLATLGYLGATATLAHPPGPIMAKLLTAGGSSLSIYLGQSIILSTLFSGYGLGLWHAVDRLTAVLVAITVTAALIAALAIWRHHHPLGPAEWLLRRITDAGLPIRPTNSPSQ